MSPIALLSIGFRLIIFVGVMFSLQACQSTEENVATIDTSNTDSKKLNSPTHEDKQSAVSSKNTSKPSANKNKKDTDASKAPLKSLPKRLAVMPFNAEEDADKDIILMLRDSVFSHLSGSNYSFIKPQAIEQRTLILKKIDNYVAADAPLLTGLLDVDAILIGNVIDSEILYAGVAASIYYKVEVMLVDAKGNIIWTDTFSERSLEGGLSADPFSMLYSLVVTAMHIGKENLFAVADKLGRQVAQAIPKPEGIFSSQNVYVESVIHDGGKKTLKYGDTIKVAVKAPKSLLTTVSIETINQIFTLQEEEPGVYTADIPVSTSWNGNNLLVTAFAADTLGNRARKISTVGLINVDNSAPDSVTKPLVTLSKDLLSATWQHPEANLRYTLYKVIDKQKILLGETNDKKLQVANVHVPFTDYQFLIQAQDSAGNKSQDTIITARYLPNNAIKQASVQSIASLPAIIDIDTVLSKKHSPFLVNKKTLLSEQANLFIEPGVVIEFAQSGSIEIQGSLYTFGGDKIKFTPLSDRMSDQAFIHLNSAAHVELNGFIIDNAGIGMQISKGRPLLENGEFLRSKFSALSISGAANVSLIDSVINGSNTSAIVVADSARLNVQSTQFLNNLPFHIQNSSTYRVEAIGNEWQPEADAFTVLGNVKY